MSRPLFSWRHAVLRSAALSATCKHVMLTLSCHMNDVGGGCYPSIDTLAAETSLSCRAVSGALNAAEAAGFVARAQHGLAGQGWRRNEYRAVFPDDSGLHYGIIPWTKSASDRVRTQVQKKVAAGLARGKIEREPCVVCGEAKTVAHHSDYTMPLDIWWLCHKHHNCLHHAEKRGAKVMNEDQHVGLDDVTNQDHHLLPEGDEPPSEGDEPPSEGDEPRSTKVTNEVRTNSTTNSTKNSTGNAAGGDAGGVFLRIPLNDKSEFEIYEEMITEWESLYPALDVRQQLRNYLGWTIANPEKRKTRRGILRSINRWLADEQDQAPGKQLRGRGRPDDWESARQSMEEIQ